MAQTRYDPDGAYLYAKALREQGTNPIVSWFTDSQGGGLNNWMQDQGNQIATRTRNDILRELTDDPMMVERVRTAQNEGRDFRKELLGDKYFINLHDAVLNTGIDNIKTKSENRLRKQFSEALAESLNADKYKADGTTAEALAESLGYKNLSPELLTELKEGEQSALKKRYENQLYRDIAQKRLENPNADINDIISTYREKYGLNLNPDIYLDPENETLKKFIKTGAGSLTSNLLSAEMSARSRLEALQRLRAMHPDLAEELSYGISSAQDMYDKQVLAVYTDVLNYFRDEAKKAGLGDDVAREHAAGFMQSQYNIDPSTILKVQKNILDIQAGNDPTALAKANYDVEKSYMDAYIRDNKDVYDALVSTTLHGDLSKDKALTSLFTEAKDKLHKRGLKDDDIVKFYNFLYSQSTTKELMSKDGLEQLIANEEELAKHVQDFKNQKNALKDMQDRVKAAEARKALLEAQKYGVKHS